MFKLLDFFIPSSYILNDNVKNDFRTNMGKMKWLSSQTQLAIDINNGHVDETCLCVVANKEDFLRWKSGKRIGLLMNHIKMNPKARLFDLFNYERSMKPCIDILTSNNYLEDDNCNVLNPVMMTGGCLNKKNVIFDPFNCLDCVKYEDVESLYSKIVSDYWSNKTKFKEIKDFDLFQLYIFHVGDC